MNTTVMNLISLLFSFLVEIYRDDKKAPDSERVISRSKVMKWIFLAMGVGLIIYLVNTYYIVPNKTSTTKTNPAVVQPVKCDYSIVDRLEAEIDQDQAKIYHLRTTLVQTEAENRNLVLQLDDTLAAKARLRNSYDEAQMELTAVELKLIKEREKREALEEKVARLERLNASLTRMHNNYVGDLKSAILN